MAGLDPAISIGMIADCDCIVRKLVWVADGRVKPGHDGGGESIVSVPGISQQPTHADGRVTPGHARP